MPKMKANFVYKTRGDAKAGIKPKKYVVVAVGHDTSEYPVTARAMKGNGMQRLTHTGRASLAGTDPFDLVEEVGELEVAD